MVRKTITFNIDTEVHRDFEQAVKDFQSIFGAHKKQFFYENAFVLFNEFLNKKKYEEKDMIVIKKSGKDYILTVNDENGFCWDQALTKEELLEIQKILNQKLKHEYKI